MILVKILARFLSCAPFRYMMFLNWEWPAIVLRGSPGARARHCHRSLDVSKPG
jgi:hypothetical protein